MKWEILQKSKSNITSVLLENRGLKSKKVQEEFLNPVNPSKIQINELGINKTDFEKAVKRIEKAKENKELVFIYGDYDADGICSTAILWETINELGIRVLPYIPDRFEDGYGIKKETVDKIQLKNPEVKLIITVDNGIVGYEGIKEAKNLGIDVIVIDHHVKGAEKLKSFATIHSTLTSGAGLAWFFCNELIQRTALDKAQITVSDKLELAAIGIVADQLPLLGVNRSLVKFGLEALNKTKRFGLKYLFEEAGLTIAGILARPITTYEVGFIIAPRINAMGRLKHGIESLRLLCTKNRIKAGQIARDVQSTNLERQQMVEQIIKKAREMSLKNNNKLLVISHDSFHEGIIGLAAGKLTEEFSRPSIVLSIKGGIAKASARSVEGFNIIEAIRSQSALYIEGGGHAMAAGFSIATSKIEEFNLAINKYANEFLTDEIIEKKLKIDCQISFDQINYALNDELKKFEPIGTGNPLPVFCSEKVEVLEAKPVGREGKHLKLKLRQNTKILDAIWFNVPTDLQALSSKSLANVAYSVEENVWNNQTSLQLKVKDLKDN